MLIPIDHVFLCAGDASLAVTENDFQENFGYSLKLQVTNIPLLIWEWDQKTEYFYRNMSRVS